MNLASYRKTGAGSGRFTVSEGVPLICDNTMPKRFWVVIKYKQWWGFCYKCTEMDLFGAEKSPRICPDDECRKSLAQRAKKMPLQA